MNIRPLVLASMAIMLFATHASAIDYNDLEDSNGPGPTFLPSALFPVAAPKDYPSTELGDFQALKIGGEASNSSELSWSQLAPPATFARRHTPRAAHSYNMKGRMYKMRLSRTEARLHGDRYQVYQGQHGYLILVPTHNE